MQMRHRARLTAVAQIAAGAQEQPCAEVPRPRKLQCRPKTRCAGGWATLMAKYSAGLSFLTLTEITGGGWPVLSRSEGWGMLPQQCSAVTAQSPQTGLISL